ncbi:hypothetical protein Poli38472_001001 [Pythium oligandrum]|uniref:Calpain catalytic domain-containing protein n=1 Tax=Pythium oligandrum TaxID=41045 RepID=A0A8K1FHF5_PYTOL|nr:hypothetical protein Poli38472_001001 [Pythium oligandrum]|eukprot:TMW60959.1 hypothetical protein Poli38472_001001 [Pythium oligandrum]
MFCGECGHRWAPDEIANARFCAECGAPREDTPPAAASAVPPPINPTAPVVTTPTSHTGGHLHGSPLMKPSIPRDASSKTLPHPISPISNRSPPTICSQCSAPYEDSAAAFCGECGHPRPAPAPPAATFDDDGDLFGMSSTTYSAPSASPAPAPVPTYAPAPSYTPAPTPSYTPPPAPSYQSEPASSSFVASGANFAYNPSHAAPLPPAPVPAPTAYTPAAPPAPPQPTAEESTPASVTLTPSSTINQISSLLSNLSVSRSDADRANREEPDGSGGGISVRSVLRARNMDSLSTRLEITNAVERNRVQPTERVEGYNVTKANDVITVARNERVELSDEQYYNTRSLPDNNDWLQILRSHRQNGTKYTDAQFPPNASSIYRDENNKRYPHLEEYIWKWKRISEFFQETAYVEITMLDEEKKLVCSIAMKSPAEAESILQIVQGNPSNIDPRFFQIAKDAVSAGLTKRRRDHLLFCTKNMISYLSEYVQDGLQRFDLLWEQSLLERYKPLAFTGVGDGAGYRVDGSDVGFVSRVSVLVPVYFQAQGTCVFDRSRESSNNRISGVGIEPGDLRLGRLADSYLFGAMSILSTSPNALAQAFPLLEPDLVRPDRVEVESIYPNEQQYNEEGVYAVRFWRNNRSRVVVVDDYIPCSQYGKPVFASFTGSNGKFEIWSVLIEKAYAKLHGGYEAIIGGQEAYALQDLYGGIPFTYTLQEKCSSEDQAWQHLSSTLQAGSLVGCSNDSVETDLPRGLKKSAAYGILRLVELDYHGERVRLVQLRNSWGTGTHQQPEKWTGTWSREDGKWHGFSRIQKIECGFQFREDHTYWMDFEAFFYFFTSIIESRNLYNFRSIPDGLGNPVSPSLSVHIVTSEWNGVTCGGREAMHLNPQYQLFSPATHGCQLTAHLEQPSRRITMQHEYAAYVAPVVFRNGMKSQRKIDLAHDVIATGTFISNRSCVLEVSLDGQTDDTSKPFVVIPATYDGKLAASLGYSLTLFTSKPTALVPISDTSTLPICCVCQRALSGSFRTFTQTSGDGQTTQVDRVCNDCVSVYRERTTPVCIHCQERIEMVDGRFSGRMYTLPDGVSVHAECIDAYRIRISDKCIHCGQAIAAIPGRFDGKYFEITGGGKCHAECMEEHQLSTAQRCQHCHDPVVKIPGRFDGRFYKLPDEQLVHFECWDAYQMAKAPKCVHCTQPVMQIPGKFDGRFYELTTGLGKVHFECWEAYQAAVLRR